MNWEGALLFYTGTIFTFALIWIQQLFYRILGTLVVIHLQRLEVSLVPSGVVEHSTCEFGKALGDS